MKMTRRRSVKPVEPVCRLADDIDLIFVLNRIRLLNGWRTDMKAKYFIIPILIGVFATAVATPPA
jgi:hypothetical protein